MLRALIPAACWLALSGQTAPAPPRVSGVEYVTAIRHWSQENLTRVAIEVTGPVKFRLERADNPPRLLLDFPETRLRFLEQGLHTIQVGDARILRIRAGHNQPRLTRIVLDLAGAVDSEVKELGNPFRLLLELRSPGARAVTARSGEPAPEKKKEPAKPPLAEAALEVKPPALLAPAAPPPVPPKPQAQAVETHTAAPVEPSPEPALMEKPATPALPPPKPARRLSNGERNMTRTLGLKLGKVVIDPGHGGHDQGTSGPGGLLEKELVLDVAQRLGALIEQRLGSEVIHTRTSDVFVPLEERTALANQHRADLFLSVHANSSPIKGISGAETYYLNFTTVKADLDVAARENAGTSKSIFELKELLQKIALKEKLGESREFAARMQRELAGAWTKMNDSARNRGVKKAPFVVLIGASMPSVLAEIGFVSNARDEALMKKPDHRQRLAEAMFRGVSQYASTLSQIEVAQRAKP